MAEQQRQLETLRAHVQELARRKEEVVRQLTLLPEEDDDDDQQYQPLVEEEDDDATTRMDGVVLYDDDDEDTVGEYSALLDDDVTRYTLLGTSSDSAADGASLLLPMVLSPEFELLPLPGLEEATASDEYHW